MSYVCPNPTCRKTKCYDHCNHCGNDIFWRPPLLDKEIAYNGPKPLNQNATVHRCMEGGTKDGKWYRTEPSKVGDIVANIRYSKEMWMWPKWVIKHNKRRLELGGDEIDECDNEDCPCHWIEGLKNRDVSSEWDRKHKEWMEKWESQPLSFERFK